MGKQSDSLSDYMTVNDAREELGFATRQSVYNYAKRDKWRSIKAGITRLFHREDVGRTKEELHPEEE